MNNYKDLFRISRTGINVLLTCAVIGMAFGAGLFCISKFSSKAADPTVTAAVLAMIALASHLVGWLMGFLFGVPRVIQERGAESASLRETNSKNNIRSNRSSVKYRVNTNLENVSDWLTKILVGVGLTQFNNIKGSLVDISRYFSSGMSDPENVEQMITLTMVYYLINGFFSGYFLTRLFFTGAFSQAEERMGTERLETKEFEENAIDSENLSQEEKKQQ